MLNGVKQGTFTLQLNSCTEGLFCEGSFTYIQNPKLASKEDRVMINGAITAVQNCPTDDPNFVAACNVCYDNGAFDVGEEFVQATGQYKSLQTVDGPFGGILFCFRDNGEGSKATIPDEATLVLSGGPHNGYSVIKGQVRGNIQTTECAPIDAPP